MKVLKKADFSKWRCVIVCDHCLSELEVEAADIRAEHHKSDGDAHGPRPAYFSFHCSCAVCSSVLQIDEEGVPKAMQFFLQKDALERQEWNVK